MAGFICNGNVYLDVYESNVLTGLRGPLYATKFAIQMPKGKTIDRQSYQRDDYGTTLDIVTLPSGSGTVEMELDSVDTEHLDFLLMGSHSDVNQTSGSITDENVNANLGRWSKLDYRGVSGVSVTTALHTASYSAITDYQVDAIAGLIKPLTTGTIVDGATLLVDYTKSELNVVQSVPGSVKEWRCKLFFDGTNLANQKKVEISIPEVILLPSGELPMIGEKFATFKLAGPIKLRTNETAPYYYKEIG